MEFSFCDSWKRPIRDGRESREAMKIDKICQNLPITDDGERWSWWLTFDGVFSSASLREAIDDISFP